MPYPAERWLKWIGNSLVVGSSFFFLETSFEMYFLTLTRGQQMLGFSLVHIAPAILGLVLLSGIFFLCLAVFALVVQVMRLAGLLKSSARYARFLLVVLCVQIIHGTLLLTYDRWASALFTNGGI
jgi:TRAP-type C4-dicarboxylate transport system permease small subunit